MKVKELISLLEGLSEVDKESTLLCQTWDPQSGGAVTYFEITSLSIVYEEVEYAKDGATAICEPPNVILVHNPNVNKLETATNDSSTVEIAPNLW